MLLSEFARAPENTASSDEFRPCFIVGCQRSGTTLLAVMLDRHSQIAVPPETNFMAGMRRQIHTRWPSNEPHEQLLSCAFAMDEIQDLRLDRRAVAARFKPRRPERRELLRAMLEQYAANRGKPRVGEKTPYHLWYSTELLKWFPHGQVIAIVRDGRDVVRSILRAPWTGQRGLRATCLKWIRSARKARRLLACHPDRFKIVRYEDLVAQPEETLRSIGEWIGLDFEEGQLAPQPSDVIAPWERQWKARAATPPDPAGIARWKHEATPHERLVLTLMMKPELERLGYRDTDLPPCSAPRLAWERFLNLLYRSGLHRLWYNLLGKHLQRKPSHRHREWARHGE